MSLSVLLLSGSFGFLYPGHKPYKSALIDAVHELYGADADITFLPVSGTSLPGIVALAKECFSRRHYGVLVMAGFGNEFFNAQHQLTEDNLTSTLGSIAELATFLPREVRALAVYGGAGKLWLTNRTDADRFDTLCELVRDQMRRSDIKVVDGVSELSALTKASEFHFSVDAKSGVRGVDDVAPQGTRTTPRKCSVSETCGDGSNITTRSARARPGDAE